MFFKYILVFFVAMVPFVELRGAALLTLAFDLNIIISTIIAIIGNIVMIPVVYFFSRKILEWGKDKPAIGKSFTWILLKGEKFGKKLKSKLGYFRYLILFLLVSIQIPAIGVWVCTTLASIFKFGFKRSLVTVSAGVVIGALVIAILNMNLLEVIF